MGVWSAPSTSYANCTGSMTMSLSTTREACRVAAFS